MSRRRRTTSSIERKVTSAKDAQKVELEARDAGVYVVQLEAYDRLKRRQQVSVDFFVGGDTPVTFARPPAKSATITTDKDKYAPGDTATLIIQSPFQNARALAIVEQPSGVYDYEFVDIANGFGRYALPRQERADAQARRAFSDHARTVEGRADTADGDIRPG